MPYVAQLTMTNLTGDSKKFTESTALFPSFTKSKEKVELGLRGLIFRKKKKKKTMSWLYSPWRSSQLSMLPVIGSLWPKGGKGNTCQWMIIKPNKNIERLSVKNNILKVWVNKRSFLLHCLVTCQEETFQSWPVTARFWCSDGIFPACKAVSKLLLFKRTPIILD